MHEQVTNVASYGAEPGLRFAVLLDGNGGCRTLDMEAVRRWTPARRAGDAGPCLSLGRQIWRGSDAIHDFLCRCALQDRSFIARPAFVATGFWKLHTWQSAAEAPR